MRRKKLKSYRSAELIDGNEDLIREILPRLPVRSLIRFKLVSKQWRSLISDPHFCLTHALKNPPTIPSRILFYNTFDGAENIDMVSLSRNGGNISSFSYPILLPPYASIKKLPIPSFDVSTAIAQSCNGLSLFGFSRSLMLYCVRNLATRQLKLIPLPHLKTNRRILICILAFDPLISPHYKLVCITEVSFCRRHILIFTSETGQWKDTNVVTFTCGDLHPKGVYWNGAVHWIIIIEPIKLKCYHFDVKAENFTVTTIPIKPEQTYNSDILYFGDIRYFGEFNGHLHLVYGEKRLFDVLELDHVTLKWVFKYRVDLNGSIDQFPEVVLEWGEKKSKYCPYFMLSVVRGEKEEDSALVMTIAGKVVSYNFRSKKVEVLSEFPSWADFIMYFRFTSAYPFVATLYPL